MVAGQGLCDGVNGERILHVLVPEGAWLMGEARRRPHCSRILEAKERMPLHLKKEKGAKAARPCKSGKAFRLVPGSTRYHRKLCEPWVSWCGPAAAASPGILWGKRTPRPAEWNPQVGEPSNLVLTSL